jgi:hypothetical protein
VTTTLRHLLATAADAVTPSADACWSATADAECVAAAQRAYHRDDLAAVAQWLSLVDSLPPVLADALEQALSDLGCDLT